MPLWFFYFYKAFCMLSIDCRLLPRQLFSPGKFVSLRKWFALAAICFGSPLLNMLPACAEVVQDLDLWLPVSLSVPLSEKTSLSANAQHRRRTYLEKTDLNIAEGQLNVGLTKKVALAAGVGYIQLGPPKRRDGVYLLQALTATQPLQHELAITGRLRTEEYFIENTGGQGIRVRLLGACSKKLGKKTTVVLSHEALYNVQGSLRGLRDNELEMRSYLGLERSITPWLKAEGGYMLVSFLPGSTPVNAGATLRHTLVMGVKIQAPSMHLEKLGPVHMPRLKEALLDPLTGSPEPVLPVKATGAAAPF